MPRIRWAMIFMCFLANVINFVDRANLAIAAPSIRAELGLDAVGMGLVLSAFFWTYAFLQLPAGWFIDKVGVRVSLALAVGWWSAFTIATGAARGLAQLVGMRLMLGVGEAAAIPSFAKVAFNWFPRSERGLASSIFDSGSRVGSALSLPLVVWLISIVGWRGSFAITGGIGIVWALAWWFIYRDPERYRAIAPIAVDALLAQRSAPAVAASPDGPKVSWLDLFRYRTIWGMMIGLFCLNFAIYFFITWFPSYLLQSRGFSLASLGTWGMLPALLAVPGGGRLGGYASDSLFRRGWSATAARKTCLVLGMLLSSSIALIRGRRQRCGHALRFSHSPMRACPSRARTCGRSSAKVHRRPRTSRSIGGDPEFRGQSRGNLHHDLYGRDAVDHQGLVRRAARRSGRAVRSRRAVVSIRRRKG